MGNGKSKNDGYGGKVLKPRPEPTPYLGVPISYHFVNIDASIQFNACFARIRPGVNINTLDVNSYIPMLNQLYQQGYRMLSFLSKPGTIQTHGFASFDATSTIRYQAVLSPLSDDSEKGKYQIRSEKSLLESRSFFTGSGLMLGRDMSSISNTDHIYQTISNMTKAGGRFVCLEITGFSPFAMGSGMGPGCGMMGAGHNNDHMRQMMMFGYNPQITVGVDLFFEIPLEPHPEIYNYSIVPLPVQSRYIAKIPFGEWIVSCDWPGLMQQYLGQGWRLVEIFLDQSQQSSAQGFGFGANINVVMNSIWVFEKPLQKMNDPTPIYEGTMLEFPVTMSHNIHAMGFGGVSTTVAANWEPTIMDMGKQGWELVRILQTPKTEISGMSDVRMTVWMFFQRKIVSSQSSIPPPSYDDVVMGKTQAP